MTFTSRAALAVPRSHRLWSILEEDHQRTPVHVDQSPRAQERGKQETAGPWQGSGSETLKCNDKSARRKRTERSTVSVKKTPEHSGSPCVTNFFVNCSSGPCFF